MWMATGMSNSSARERYAVYGGSLRVRPAYCAEFHAYLNGLTRAGFGSRLMFGSDQMFWTDLIAMSVDAVDSAPFLTPADKRAIFHDNAVRFYRL